MAIKLLDPNKIVKWQFEADKGDKEAMVFHIKPRTNKDRMASTYFMAFGKRTLDDFIMETYINHVIKVENVPTEDDNVVYSKPEQIKDLVERLPEDQGAELELAIKNIQGWLDKGTVKN